jgi:hypothetical protein
MSHNWITPIDEDEHDERVPQEKAAIAHSRVEHETHPDIVALACTLSIPRLLLLKRTLLALPTQTRLAA